MGRWIWPKTKIHNPNANYYFNRKIPRIDKGISVVVAHTLSSTTEFFTSGDDHSDWVFLAHRVKIENEPCLLLLLNGGLVLYLGSFSYCMEEFRPPTMQWGVSLLYDYVITAPALMLPAIWSQVVGVIYLHTLLFHILCAKVWIFSSFLVWSFLEKPNKICRNYNAG